MFISVDFPAPFSPSSACTSPLRRSKSTWSFATTPGNRFVMPRISRTVEASTDAGFYEGATGACPVNVAGTSKTTAGPEGPAVRYRCSVSLELARDLELLLDDLHLDRIHLLDERLRHRRVDLADTHAAVLQVEEKVAAGNELPVLHLLDRLVDAVVDSLDPGRENALRVPVLVLVDADAPRAGRSSRLQGAEATAASNLE